MKQKSQLGAFAMHQVSQLNKISGGVKNTTWTSQSTGWKYKDYEYGANELNATSAPKDDYGGTDKTFDLA